MKGPESNVIGWLTPSVREKDVGWALLPVICTLKEGVPGHDPPPPDTTQDFLINRTPVDGFPDVPIVLGIPLLTLFAALWLHESDIWLSAPTVSQFAFCLVFALGALSQQILLVNLLCIYLLVRQKLWQLILLDLLCDSN